MRANVDIYVFYYYHWADTAAGWLLAPEGIIRPVVSILALSLFIRYICHWNLQFLNNIIMIKTKVLIPRAYVTFVGFGYMFRHFVFIAPKHF